MQACAEEARGELPHINDKEGDCWNIVNYVAAYVKEDSCHVIVKERGYNETYIREKNESESRAKYERNIGESWLPRQPAVAAIAALRREKQSEAVCRTTLNIVSVCLVSYEQISVHHRLEFLTIKPNMKMWILVAAWIWSMATSYQVTEINDLVNKTKSKCMPPVMLLQILKKQKLKPQLPSFLEEQLKVTKHAEKSEKHEVNVKSKEQFEVSPFERKDRFQLMHIRLLRRTLKCGSQFY
ncbi:hypothetical protein NC652_032143 [Populus alba x Populus x berolinensis]|nr:hypothetical protein NC652_032143 [Populus alba x Populus x berolinensis]